MYVLFDPFPGEPLIYTTGHCMDTIHASDLLDGPSDHGILIGRI